MLYHDKHTFIKLFKMCVRSLLEYCGSAWSPWLQKDNDLLEKVQQRDVNAGFGLTGGYYDKLLQLKLPTLVDRRRWGDMIQTYKLVNEVDDVDANKFFPFSSMQHGHATRQVASISGNEALPSLGLSRNQCKLRVEEQFLFSTCCWAMECLSSWSLKSIVWSMIISIPDWVKD